MNTDTEETTITVAPMDLRDYLAGQWLAGYIANPGPGYESAADAADAAYKTADAFLAARAAK